MYFYLRMIKPVLI